jgi:cysteinyl-tRNA synthetase
MVRRANVAFDSGAVKKNDVAPLLDALAKFDAIFAVLHDDDAAKMKQVLDWATAEGRTDISSELREATAAGESSDADIEKKIADMKAARTARDFKVSDAIRNELAAVGILVEITKDGIRWRRK